MKYFNLISLFVLALLFNIHTELKAQRVYPLVPDISADSILQVRAGATKLALDPLTGRLFYSTLNGDIYEVYIPLTGISTDSLRYTSIDHGISYLQGLCFRDSNLYLCGNVWSTSTGIGKIVKGTLQSNGTRIWSEMVTTDPYPSGSTSGDHGFAGIITDPAGNNIYVSSGARTLLGEVRTNGGVWPGQREVPLTTRIFKFPVATLGLVLPDDSILIGNIGFLFASGTRNAYDMAWDGNDTLFAIDNSGERDDPEELNWLRQGMHYGFPWRMGGNDNPLQFSPYDVNTDPLVNHLSGGYLSGLFADDPAFPQAPSGLTFMEPVRNLGLVADFYRDPVTGSVKNASDEGTYISSFTPHRSPLGLVFDRDSVLASPYRGDGFLVNFMPGGDSAGYTPLSPWGSPCPFVDTARELVQIKLTYDAGIDNYTMLTSSIAGGFYLPVDAQLKNNELYVIENGGNLWKITFPLYVGLNEQKNSPDLKIYPNPFHSATHLTFFNPSMIRHSLIIYSTFGEEVRRISNIMSDEIHIERSDLSNGIYFIELISESGNISTGKIIIN
jgi:hypothetical protein